MRGNVQLLGGYPFTGPEGKEAGVSPLAPSIAL
jgi:hypothetical protein